MMGIEHMYQTDQTSVNHTLIPEAWADLAERCESVGARRCLASACAHIASRRE